MTDLASRLRDMKSPYADIPKDLLFDAAKMFLPDDGTDWDPIIEKQLSWLNERAIEDEHQNGEWFAWRASDPLELALLAGSHMGFEYWAVVHDKWFRRVVDLTKTHRQRFYDLKRLRRGEVQ